MNQNQDNGKDHKETRDITIETAMFLIETSGNSLIGQLLPREIHTKPRY